MTIDTRLAFHTADAGRGAATPGMVERRNSFLPALRKSDLTVATPAAADRPAGFRHAA